MDSDCPFLPLEIMTNILKRLPVKSLIRFQCVCKEWKNLIKTPYFIGDHLQHSNNQKPLLLWHRSDRSKRRHLHMLDYKSRVLEVLPSPFNLLRTWIMGSSNGLLCVKIYNEGPSLPSLLLWNPATREVRELPQPINSKGDFRAGFGFTASVNDYKIVKYGAMQFFDGEDNRVQVFSLSTGSWKEIKVGNSRGVVLHYYPPVTVGGAMFWIVCKPGEEEEGNDWMIISFDLVMEVFAWISLPTSLNFGSYDKLTVYENKVAILSLMIGDDESRMIDLWVMDEGSGASGERWGWSKIFTVSTSSVMIPCCIWSDEMVCEVDTLRTDDEMALYLLNLNTLELEIFGSCRRGSCPSVTPNYVESLVTVGNIRIEEP